MRLPNTFDPDLAQHFVGPDLDPNGLRRLSAGCTSRQRDNGYLMAHMKTCKIVFNPYPASIFN